MLCMVVGSLSNIEILPRHELLKRLGTRKRIQTVLKIDMTIVVHAPRPGPPTRAEHVGQEADAVAVRLALSV